MGTQLYYAQYTEQVVRLVHNYIMYSTLYRLQGGYTTILCTVHCTGCEVGTQLYYVQYIVQVARWVYNYTMHSTLYRL